MLTRGLLELVDNLQTEASKSVETPSDWIERNFYVPDPRDFRTGEVLPPGPMILTPHQRHIINEALSKKPDGTLKYSTIIYSAPKKSGKSALTSAVGMYIAHHNPNSFIACLANDKKQSNDRIYGPIRTNFRLHRQYGGIFSNVRDNKTEVILPNFTKIEALPCDAPGEAGSQPLATLWSEIWGFDTDNKKRMWIEMTIPPTLYGRAIRWVESYAGHIGKSELLEQLYETAVMGGTPHPDFDYLTSDLSDNGDAVVFVNEKASTFAYWDHEPRMIWQTPDFYAQEATMHSPSEFKRVHKNIWVAAVDSFIQPEWWDACHSSTLMPLAPGDPTPVVVAIDNAETRDCAALVAVTRSPFDPKNSVAVRAVRVFTPEQGGGIINQEQTLGYTIKEWFSKWNIICWAYDPREMAKLAQDYTLEGFGWFFKFGQVNPRAIADKQLHDMIVQRQVIWSAAATEGDVGFKGDSRESLYKHVTQAGASTTNESYRLQKLSTSSHIDAAVALSMATCQAMKLSIDNLETNQMDLLVRLRKGELTQEQFSELMRAQYPELQDRTKNGR